MSKDAVAANWFNLELQNGVRYSNPAGTPIPDVTAPSVPVLTAIAVSSSQINISWTASTDDYGVTGYTLQRSLDNVTWTTLKDSLTLSHVESGRPASTLHYYRVRAYDAAGNQSAWATAQATTQAVAGNIYWLQNPANAGVITTPGGNSSLFPLSSFATIDGRESVAITCNDTQGNRGLEIFIAPPNLGAPINRSVFWRFWMKLSDDFAIGSSGENKWKIGRINHPTLALGYATFYFWPNKWEMEELGDGFDSFNLSFETDNNPATNASMKEWGEYIFEVVYPPSAAELDNSFFRFYKNGALLGQSNVRQWFSRLDNHVAQWGGVGTRVYPQLNSFGTGGGTIYIGETSITDYLYTTY